MTVRITKGSVLDDLQLTQHEAQNLKIRATLMREIEHQIKLYNWTQAQAAKILSLNQPRISDLMRGKIELFTIDMLVNLLNKFNVNVSLVIDERIAA